MQGSGETWCFKHDGGLDTRNYEENTFKSQSGFKSIIFAGLCSVVLILKVYKSLS